MSQGPGVNGTSAQWREKLNQRRSAKNSDDIQLWETGKIVKLSKYDKRFSSLVFF